MSSCEMSEGEKERAPGETMSENGSQTLRWAHMQGWEKLAPTAVQQVQQCPHTKIPPESGFPEERPVVPIYPPIHPSLPPYFPSETRFHCVGRAGLEFVSLLPPVDEIVGMCYHAQCLASFGLGGYDAFIKLTANCAWATVSSVLRNC